jgi:hypothetical protein
LSDRINRKECREPKKDAGVGDHRDGREERKDHAVARRPEPIFRFAIAFCFTDFALSALKHFAGRDGRNAA